MSLDLSEIITCHRAARTNEEIKSARRGWRESYVDWQREPMHRHGPRPTASSDTTGGRATTMEIWDRLTGDRPHRLRQGEGVHLSLRIWVSHTDIGSNIAESEEVGQG